MLICIDCYLIGTGRSLPYADLIEQPRARIRHVKRSLRKAKIKPHLTKATQTNADQPCECCKIYMPCTMYELPTTEKEASLQ